MSEEVIIDNTPAEKELSLITIELDKVWMLKLSKEGIVFNREAYPQATADDFAKAFLNVLEQNFDVKFIKRNASHLDLLKFINELTTLMLILPIETSQQS